MNKKFSTLIVIVMFSILLNVTSTTQSDQSINKLGLNQRLEHPYLEITSEQQLQSVAAQEGWSGTGSLDNPIIIENYLFTGAETDPVVMSTIRSSMYFVQPQLLARTFSLVITNIRSHIVIQNNQFSYAGLVNTSMDENGPGQVKIENNEWVTSDNPNNLVLFGSNFEVRQNTFYGNNLNCEGEKGLYTSRLYMQGHNSIIEKNIFEADGSCHPTSHIYLETTTEVPGILKRDYIVTNNNFKTSNLAISSNTNAKIEYNDIEVGEFGIFIVPPSMNFVVVNYNNFYISEIGVVGDQNYDKTIGFISYGYQKYDAPGWNGLTHVDHNHYSNITSPDENRDGIVETAVEHAYRAIDSYPHVNPFSTYHHPLKSPDKADWQQYAFIAISTISIGFVSYYYVVPRIKAQRKIYSGVYSEGVQRIIGDLFESQTVLYYTLLGQNKINDPDIESNLQDAIPKKIYDFKYLLHPIRMSMMKLLYENLEISSIEMKNIMKISWNEYTNNSVSLRKKGFVNIQEGFVDGKKRQLLTIEPKGAEQFKALLDLLHLFMDNSTDLSAYIKTAQDRLDSTETDLYPTS